MPLTSIIRRVAVTILCFALLAHTAAVPAYSRKSRARSSILEAGARVGAKLRSNTGSNVDALERASLGVQKLQTWYNESKGLWRTTNWWNAANALTVLVNYSVVSGSTTYQPAVQNTFDRNASSGFVNYYYDDDGWWALAWIDAYDWTQDPRYLNMAGSIFDEMTTAWDDVCGGGIWWSKARGYKNAIANELFLSVAAHLANRTSDPDLQARYAAWAQQEWDWFLQSGMINGDNLVNDGLDKNTCQNNHKTTWSYNQGVILGGLVELYQQNPDWSLPQIAHDIAFATIDSPLVKLTDANDILHDRCEPGCGADGPQFKGIFVRNLMALNDLFPDERYVQFVTVNAQSIWDFAQNPNPDSPDEFGVVWSGPFDKADAARQSSALDALVAAAEMSAVPSATYSTRSTCNFCPEISSLPWARRNPAIFRPANFRPFR